jgi:hypothetical protein
MGSAQYSNHTSYNGTISIDTPTEWRTIAIHYQFCDSIHVGTNRQFLPTQMPIQE